MTRRVAALVGLAALCLLALPRGIDAQNRQIGVNVLLNTPITNDIVASLSAHGRVLGTMVELNALTMRAPERELPVIRALPFVAAANPDAERKGAPVDTVSATNFGDGLSTWDQDAINVTDFGVGRAVGYNGTGVYVAVIDTGLLDSWRQYFPQERIATEYAIAFSGGGGERGNVTTTPNVWEHDQNSHGTHVTSTILGYSLSGTPINGVAPMATVIPVKVLGQNGSGWSSEVAAGIVYVTDLKIGPLADYPVVINMSLGGPSLDALEKAAVDYAVDNGVIVVAAAGNEGTAGMGYPGAYKPVISVAASGWIREWQTSNWWYGLNVPDPTNPADYYIADFSSRELPGQELDVAAPGSWVVGPYQTQSGKTSYYYLGGTSMASPHVAGIAALMMQKNGALVQGQVEGFLRASATALPVGCRSVRGPSGPPASICWGSDATGWGLVTADAALTLVP